MKKIGLIIGFGSIGIKHFKSMSKSKIFKKIYILSKHFKSNKNCIDNLSQISEINPDVIVICSETSSHLNQLKFIEKNFSKKIILVEKPLFSKSSSFKIKNNKVFVAYNLRYDPILQYIKKFISNKKIICTNINCNSYLPSWRNRNYKKLYSADKNKGGGVHLDLSHEIDYANWILKNLKKRSITLKKISNLKINSYDYANFLGSSYLSKIVNINLNYFSQKDKRNIEIFTNNIFLFIDLINRKIEFKSNKIIKIKKFKKISSIDRMTLQIKDVLKTKPSFACSYKNGMQVLKLLGL